jgi:hypothetical protein
VSGQVSGLIGWCALGVVGGLAVLVRGLAGYRAGVTISGTSTSRIATLAAGEVRLSGTVEAGEVLLRSPLQDRECVWYRSRISGGDEDPGFHEERGVGFRIRDASGAIRVFPRGARIDVPNQYHEQGGMLGEGPVGFSPRRSTFAPVGEPLDREAAVAELLTVHQPTPHTGRAEGIGSHGRQQAYSEARIEPGDVITIVGSARPFSDLEDPATADALEGSLDPLGALDDPVIAADLEAARASGTLLAPEAAWGNAAIPGFGIDRPVRAPTLDADAHRPTLATAAEADRITREFDIPPDTLVLASAHDAPLLIVAGTPGEAAARSQGRFLMGLAGAVVAIASAVAGAILLSAR